MVIPLPWIYAYFIKSAFFCLIAYISNRVRAITGCIYGLVESPIGSLLEVVSISIGDVIC